MDWLKNSFRLDFFFNKKTPFFSTVENQNMGIKDALYSVLGNWETINERYHFNLIWLYQYEYPDTSMRLYLLMFCFILNEFYVYNRIDCIILLYHFLHHIFPHMLSIIE